jgi:thymidylate synthase (FAD)
MKTIRSSYEILDKLDDTEVAKKIELIGRVCYKSEDKISDGTAVPFCKMLIGKKHDAMLEHYSFSVKFTCDRGVSHEIVRHRIASYAQESTRYCNYSLNKFGSEITVVEPMLTGKALEHWKKGCIESEKEYFGLLDENVSPQIARGVLPNSLKTEIVMTANIREWRHFFDLRCAPTAHPQMREITIPLLNEISLLLPTFFKDVYDKFFVRLDVLRFASTTVSM